MITATVSSKHTNSERKIDPNSTIQSLCGKLESVTGIPPDAQQWVITLPSGHALNTEFLSSDPISTYLPDNTQSIHIDVQDSRPEQDQFNLDESVEKYEMSDSKYQARQDSVLKWKQANHLGRFSSSPPATRQQDPPLDNLSPGTRVSVTLKSGKCPNGTVGYVGPIPELPGNSLWIGVALDSPDGKNDGSVKGHRYFECQDSHGVYVKPSAIQPERTSTADYSDDEI